MFVKTAENVSDPFTKNVSGEVYERHSANYIADKTYLNDPSNYRKGVEKYSGDESTESSKSNT